MADVTLTSPPLYVFLPEIKHAGKYVEKLTQAKYKSNARRKGSNLTPHTLPLCAFKNSE